jgi:transposase-like protein
MQPFVPVEALFKGRHFDGKIIILCVSWYASFKLSLRDLVIMMADRGIRLTHTTILRWVQRYVPEFEKRWSRNRDVNAAKAFLRGVMKNTRPPNKITLDAYAASHRAVRGMKGAGELPQRVRVRSSQYLNNPD